MSTDLSVIEAALKAARDGRAVMHSMPIQHSMPGFWWKAAADVRDFEMNAYDMVAELVERVKVAEAEVERVREQNTRYATRLATCRESMQQQLDPTFATLAAMREVLAGDWSPEAPGEWELNAERVRVLRELLGVTS